MSPKARNKQSTERRLIVHVTVTNPDSGRSETYGPDDALPSWFEDACTNPDVWGAVVDDEEPAAEAEEPSGHGDGNDGSGEPAE